MTTMTKTTMANEATTNATMTTAATVAGRGESVRAAEGQAVAAPTTETGDDLSLIARACRRRAEAYALLSDLYRAEVSEAFLDRLREIRFPANTGSQYVDDGCRLMARYLSKPRDGVLLELAVDYARTFIGAGTDARSAAYPFESVYTSEKRLEMQDARDEVLAAYRSEGLDKSEEWKDGEDHVSLELQFEQILCERAADALDAGNEDAATRLLRTQRAFLRYHLLNWVPRMTADMARFSRTDLYRGLARLTEGFLSEEAALLDELLSEDDVPIEGVLPKVVPAAEISIEDAKLAKPLAHADSAALAAAREAFERATPEERRRYFAFNSIGA
jgi:TorA maturation chaperone TorD